MTNHAVSTNPPHGLDFHITSHGSDWYFAAFALFGIVAVVLSGYGYRFKPTNTVANTIASLFFISIAYFTLGSDLGWVAVESEFRHKGTRQIFYARYIGWFLAFPPFLTNFAILTGIPTSKLFYTILAQETAVVNLLIGALIPSVYKWGFFTFGTVALLLVAHNLLITFRASAHQNTEGTVSPNSYFIVSGGAVFLLVLYPVAWALADGANVIVPDSEAAFYGVLDVLLFVGVQGAFHFFFRNIAGDYRPSPLDSLLKEKKSIDYELPEASGAAPHTPTAAASTEAPHLEPTTTQV